MQTLFNSFNIHPEDSPITAALPRDQGEFVGSAKRYLFGEDVQVSETSCQTSKTTALNVSICEVFLPHVEFLPSQKGFLQVNSRIDCGLLVGVLNPQDASQGIISPLSFKLKIGPQGDISCLSSLRNFSLDSIVIYWSQNGCGFKLVDIFSTKQRLIFILPRSSASAFLKESEQIILDLFEEKGLEEKEEERLCNVMAISDNLIIEFQMAQLYQRDYQLQRDKNTDNNSGLISEIPLQDQEQEGFNNLTVDDKLSGNSFQIEAEYFSKAFMNEQKQKCSEEIDEHLQIYFFNNPSDCSSDQFCQKRDRIGIPKPFSWQRKTRSKSEDTIIMPCQEDLDDELFNKY